MHSVGKRAAAPERESLHVFHAALVAFRLHDPMTCSPASRLPLRAWSARPFARRLRFAGLVLHLSWLLPRRVLLRAGVALPRHQLRSPPAPAATATATMSAGLDAANSRSRGAVTMPCSSCLAAFQPPVCPSTFASPSFFNPGGGGQAGRGTGTLIASQNLRPRLPPPASTPHRLRRRPHSPAVPPSPPPCPYSRIARSDGRTRRAAAEPDNLPKPSPLDPSGLDIDYPLRFPPPTPAPVTVPVEVSTLRPLHGADLLLCAALRPSHGAGLGRSILGRVQVPRPATAGVSEGWGRNFLKDVISVSDDELSSCGGFYSVVLDHKNRADEELATEVAWVVVYLSAPLERAISLIVLHGLGNLVAGDGYMVDSVLIVGNIITGKLMILF
ncbi:hypothetical protein ABZP36_021065 [Zizania latifolia]